MALRNDNHDNIIIRYRKEHYTWLANLMVNVIAWKINSDWWSMWNNDHGKQATETSSVYWMHFLISAEMAKYDATRDSWLSGLPRT